MNVYSTEIQLKSKDVDMYRRLRTSELFRLLQEASIRHTELLGMGRDKTLDRGILWVLLMQRAEIVRMPEYDEHIVLKSWPGKTMHLLFPRYYSLETADGEQLLKASAMWSLVDEKSRKVVFPEKYGVVIEGTVTGEEIAMPSSVRRQDTDSERDFTVPYSFVDLNGHMNNTRYFDLAEDCVGQAEAGRKLRAVSVEYQNEARLGETLHLRWGGTEGSYFLAGETERPVFRMKLSAEHNGHIWSRSPTPYGTILAAKIVLFLLGISMSIKKRGASCPAFFICNLIQLSFSVQEAVSASPWAFSPNTLTLPSA